MPGEECMHIKHGGETPRKDLPLQGKGPSHDTLIIQHLGVGVHLKLPLNTPPIRVVDNWDGDSTQW